MVLIDPTHEDQREEYRKLDPQKRTLEEWVKQGNPQREFFRKCADAAAQGLIAGTAIYKECIGDPDPSYSADAYASYLRSTLTPGYWLAQLSENENVFNASSDQVRAARQSLGEIPLVVLTSAPRPRREPETQAENDVRNLVPVKLHEQIAALSSHGVHRAIADSGHDIQADQPKAVVDAILEVLEDAREPKVQAQPVPSP